MASISGSKQPRKINDGQNNKVLGVQEVKTFAVRFTNSAGEEDVGLGFIFGTTDKGHPGVWVLPFSKLNELGLAEAYAYIREGVLQHFEKAKAAKLEANDELAAYTPEEE